MTDEKIYPISEIFISPQGEGLYAGTLMTFIRLAGCSVGKPFPKSHYATVEKCMICGGPGPLVRPQLASGECCYECASANNWPVAKLLPIYTEMCTLYDGRTFECDTDYRVKQRLTVQEIYKWMRDNKPIPDRVCITGGEPLIHDLRDLVEGFVSMLCPVHLETSGSKPIPDWMQELLWNPFGVWLTVSPKAGWLPETISLASELKFLVDENFDIEKATEVARCVNSDVNPSCLFYLQPVNYENKINEENMKRCLALQRKYTYFRISDQSHKQWGVR